MCGPRDLATETDIKQIQGCSQGFLTSAGEKVLQGVVVYGRLEVSRVEDSDSKDRRIRWPDRSQCSRCRTRR